MTTFLVAGAGEMPYSPQLDTRRAARVADSNTQPTSDGESQLPDTASLRECDYPHSSFADCPPSWGRLLSLNCAQPGKELINTSYTIGRDPSCELLITKKDVEDFSVVSKLHCSISRTDIGQGDYAVFLKDLSSNGTSINGHKLMKNKPEILSNRDEISFAFSKPIFMFIKTPSMDSNWMPPDLASKYLVLKHLGTGGFAEVKLVVDKSNYTKLAVKRVSKSEGVGSKIFNEVKILRKLHHPCIVQMDDLIETQEAAFIFMEYVPDGNLLERLRRDKMLTEPLSKIIFFQLASAVSHMHSKGVTHRDLKPENILVLDQNEGHVVVKVADFGLSKVLSTMTSLKSCCGTLEYTAPEILLSRGRKQYTSKVDVWGLGVVLFLCLSGRRPFSTEAGDTNDVMDKITRGRYSLETPEWSSVSTVARRLVNKLLTTNPHDRMDSHQVLQENWFKDDQLFQSIHSMSVTRALIEALVSEPPIKRQKLST